MFPKFMKFQKRAIQATFNIKNYTRNFRHNAIQTLPKPSYTQYSFALAAASALSFSVYCNQCNKTNNVAASTSKELAVVPVTISGTKSIQIYPNHRSYPMIPIDKSTSPDPYPTWTEKEIMEQPQAISKALQFGTVFSYKNGDENIHLQPLSNNKATLEQIKDLVITGCGPSMNAALYAKRLMEYIQSFDTVQIVDSSAPDTLDCTTTNAMGILAVGSDNKIADSLGINPLNIVSANEEQTFTSSVTVLTLIAAWFSQLNSKSESDKERAKVLIDALHKLHTFVGGVIFRNKNKCIEIGKEMSDMNGDSVLVLGKGFGECIAHEGCDKLKGITGMNASVSGDVNSDISVVCIVLDDEYSEEMVEKAKECVNKGGEMVYITDNKELLNGLSVDNNRVIEIPHNGPLTALLAVVPLQLLAYYIAMAKGVNPDKNEE